MLPVTPSLLSRERHTLFKSRTPILGTEQALLTVNPSANSKPSTQPNIFALNRESVRNFLY